MGETRARFGPYRLDNESGQLLRDGTPVAVGQRGIALLAALLAADGGVVSKAELIEAAWPGSIVEEGNLTVQIAALRRALGPRPDGQEWIATVPRVGYRLLRGGGEAIEPDKQSGLPALAVLPFQNLSGTPSRSTLRTAWWRTLSPRSAGSRASR